MKPISKQTNKWLLSTLLVAALGSQYYFSVSSKSLGSFEMSSEIPSTASENMSIELRKLDDLQISRKEYNLRSAAIIAKYAPQLAADKIPLTAAQEYAVKLNSIHTNKAALSPEEIAKDEAALEKEYAPKIAAEKKSEIDKASKAEVEKPKVVTVRVNTNGTAAPSFTAKPAGETEGKSQKPAACAECEGAVSITGSEESIAAITKILAAAPKAATTSVATTTGTTIAAKDSSPGPETAAERREREKQEREDKKEAERTRKAEIKQAKIDALNEKKMDRNDLFAEKAEAMADKCQNDLDCKVRGLTSLMENFSGPRKVDQFAVTKAYNLYIDKDLKAGLRGEDGSEGKTAALEAIQTLMASNSTEYRAIKARAVDSAKVSILSEANAANTLYKQAELISKQNPIEYPNAINNARGADQTVRLDVAAITNTMYEGLASAGDSTTKSYILNNFVPDVNSMLARIMNTGGVLTPATTVPASTTGARGGRNGTSTVVNGTTSSTNVNDGVIFRNQTTGQSSNVKTGSVQLK